MNPPTINELKRDYRAAKAEATRLLHDGEFNQAKIAATAAASIWVKLAQSIHAKLLGKQDDEPPVAA